MFKNKTIYGKISVGEEDITPAISYKYSEDTAMYGIWWSTSIAELLGVIKGGLCLVKKFGE